MLISGHGEQKYASGGRMLRSSTGRRWSNILAEQWRHSAAHLPAILPRDTEISVQFRGRSLVERKGVGPRQRILGTEGTVWLCPANIQEEYINISDDVECLHLYIPGKPFSNLMLQEFDLDSKNAVLRYESIKEDQFILQIARLIQSELDHETSSGRLLVESLGNTLAAYLTRTYSEAVLPSNNSRSSKPLDSRRLLRVQDFIASNISTDFGIDDLAEVACLSPAHFSRCFKKATGCTPHEFVSRMRLDAAKKMLVNDVHSIGEIAFASGFSSQADFSRAFRRATNMTPRQYRERER